MQLLPVLGNFDPFQLQIFYIFEKEKLPVKKWTIKILDRHQVSYKKVCMIRILVRTFLKERTAVS